MDDWTICIWLSFNGFKHPHNAIRTWCKSKNVCGFISKYLLRQCWMFLTFPDHFQDELMKPLSTAIQLMDVPNSDLCFFLVCNYIVKRGVLYSTKNNWNVNKNLHRLPPPWPSYLFLRTWKDNVSGMHHLCKRLTGAHVYKLFFLAICQTIKPTKLKNRVLL